MSTLAEVRLWGKTIGAVSLQDGEDVASSLSDFPAAERPAPRYNRAIDSEGLYR